MTLFALAPWFGMLGTAIVGVLAFWLKHQSAKTQVATVQADAAQKIAAATSQRDQTLAAVAEARDAIAQGNADAAQASLQSAQERTNVEEETRTAGRASNLAWMQEHGLIRSGEGAGATASHGVSAAGSGDPAPGTTTGSSGSNTHG